MLSRMKGQRHHHREAAKIVAVIKTLGQLPRMILRRRYVPGLYRWAERRARLYRRS